MTFYNIVDTYDGLVLGFVVTGLFDDDEFWLVQKSDDVCWDGMVCCWTLPVHTGVDEWPDVILCDCCNCIASF